MNGYKEHMKDKYGDLGNTAHTTSRRITTLQGYIREKVGTTPQGYAALQEIVQLLRDMDDRIVKMEESEVIDIDHKLLEGYKDNKTRIMVSTKKHEFVGYIFELKDGLIGLQVVKEQVYVPLTVITSLKVWRL